MTTIHMVIYDGVDELDLCGPYEVLSSCRRVIDGRWGNEPAFRVELVSEQDRQVICANGMAISPTKRFSQIYESEVVIVPGGPGGQRETLPKALLGFLIQAKQQDAIIASVCTGAFILGKLGLLDRRRVTTHSARMQDLARMYPTSYIIRGQRVVFDGAQGNLMTSSGISAGIDLALSLIARLEGKETAMFAARRIEWPLPVITNEALPHEHLKDLVEIDTPTQAVQHGLMYS